MLDVALLEVVATLACVLLLRFANVTAPVAADAVVVGGCDKRHGEEEEEVSNAAAAASSSDGADDDSDFRAKDLKIDEHEEVEKARRPTLVLLHRLAAQIVPQRRRTVEVIIIFLFYPMFDKGLKL